MRAAAKYTRSRVRVDLATETFYLQSWDKTANAWVTEGATTGSYTISLGQAAATPVTVNLSYGGTATGGGTDYTGTTSVTIPAGATSVTFTLPTSMSYPSVDNERDG